MRFSYPPGSTPLDGFTIEQGLGVGGFGEVYRAVSDVGKLVALKKIQRNLDIELRGVRQCINLKHVNLISLWDIKTDQYGESWVVMEYVPGPSLRDVVHAHPNGLPEEEVKRWFVSTASGVAYLHQQDIVHRDLKPGNIFLDEETHVIKIGDYGLSKFMNTSRRSGQTESVGTFHYMAPEIGRGVYGREIDIYALGIILFEILTGDVPFDGESTQEIIMKHLTDDPKLDRVPAAFRKAIRISLQKDPELRYHNVPEMLADLPWPEIAENCQKIIAINTIGPLVSGVKIVSGVKTVSQSIPAPVTDPWEITHDHLARESKPPVAGSPIRAEDLIGDDEVQIIPTHAGADIVFGPLKDLSQSGPQSAAPLSASGSRKPEQPSADYSRIKDKGKTEPTLPPTSVASRYRGDDLRQTSPTAAAGVLTRVPHSIEIDYSNSGKVGVSGGRFDEPLARSVQNYLNDLSHWWAFGTVSTPVKVVLLSTLSLMVVINSAWLLPLALTLGLIYLCYYSLRTWWLGESTKPNHRAIKKIALDELRSRLLSRTLGQRIFELAGSLAVAVLACWSLSLLGLAIGGVAIEPNKAIWQAYGWLASTSTFAVCGLLLLSKFWEDRPGETLMRRFGMIVLGILVGLVSFAMANMFEINLIESLHFGKISGIDSKIVIKGLPVLPALLIFHAGLFGILRWWLLADPMRGTRLSILGVSFALVWATLFSLLLALPVLPNCILAVVISISVQLAAPWWSLDEARREVKRG